MFGSREVEPVWARCESRMGEALEGECGDDNGAQLAHMELAKTLAELRGGRMFEKCAGAGGWSVDLDSRAGNPDGSTNILVVEIMQVRTTSKSRTGLSSIELELEIVCDGESETFEVKRGAVCGKGRRLGAPGVEDGGVGAGGVCSKMEVALGMARDRTSKSEGAPAVSGAEGRGSRWTWRTSRLSGLRDGFLGSVRGGSKFTREVDRGPRERREVRAQAGEHIERWRREVRELGRDRGGEVDAAGGDRGGLARGDGDGAGGGADGGEVDEHGRGVRDGRGTVSSLGAVTGCGATLNRFFMRAISQRSSSREERFEGKGSKHRRRRPCSSSDMGQLWLRKNRRVRDLVAKRSTPASNTLEEFCSRDSAFEPNMLDDGFPVTDKLAPIIVCRAVRRNIDFALTAGWQRLIPGRRVAKGRKM
ncbi:hypothetical protein FB451DRAFT_1176862 [Mycena latifolia]|nr:hypothetical protein FB451DRAFT_1176862 [Mycena latifolia]